MKVKDYCRLMIGLLLTTSAFLPEVHACKGTPRTPCSKSVVLNVLSPGTVVLSPGGGTFDIDLNVWASGTAFPPPGFTCPLPVSATWEVTLRCNGVVEDTRTGVAPIAGPGFNPITVTLTALSGPPRLCTIDAVVRVAYTDGMVLEDSVGSGRDDTGGPAPVVCIADDAGGGVPGIEVVLVDNLLNPITDPLLRVHPGSHARYQYCITNNTPNTFFGKLRVGAWNNSDLPRDLTPAGVPNPLNDEPFTPADPVGDTIPIAFADTLNTPCLPLPADPRKSVPYVRCKYVVIPPGTTIYCPMLARPWGLCNTGTCTESVAVLEGTYLDPTTGARIGPGLGCAPSAVIAVDDSVPPVFDCPDQGSVAQVQLLGNDSARFFVDSFFDIDYRISFDPPTVGGQDVDQVNDQLIPATDGKGLRGEITMQNGTPTTPAPFPPDEEIKILLRPQWLPVGFGEVFPPGPPFVMEGTPNGYSHIAPVLHTDLGIFPQTGEQDLAAEIATQFFARGQGPNGPVWLDIVVIPQPDGSILVCIKTPSVPIGPVQMWCDLRMFGGRSPALADPFVERTFDGRTVQPLGQAQLNTDGGALTVSNIGSSGQDGVSIDIPNGQPTTLADLPTGSFNVDSFFDIEYRIEFQGAGGATGTGSIGERLQEVGGQLQLGASKNGNGIRDEMMIQFWLGGELREMLMVQHAPDLAMITTPDGSLPEVTRVGTVLDEPTMVTEICFATPALFTSVQWPYQLFADCVQLHRPNDYSSTSYTGLELRAGDPPGGNFQVDSFFDVWTDVSVSGGGGGGSTASDSFFDIVYSDLAGIRRVRPIGGADIGAADVLGGDRQGQLTVSNIGSSGEDGVSIDLRPDTDGFVRLKPLDLNIPDAKLNVRASGFRDGIPGRNLGELTLCYDRIPCALRCDTNFEAAFGSGTGVRVEVVDSGGGVVGSAVVPDGQGVCEVAPAPGQGLPRITGIGKPWPPIGPPCFVIPFDRPFDVILPDGSTISGGSELRLLADGVGSVVERIQQLELRGGGAGAAPIPIEMVALSLRSVEPIIVNVDKATPDPGDVIIITGLNFGDNPDDLCVVAMPQGSDQVVPFEVLGVSEGTVNPDGSTNGQIRARMLQPPPGLVGIPAQLMLARGEGRRGTPELAFPDAVVEEPVWVWRLDQGDVDNENQNPPPPEITPGGGDPPPAGTVWFHGQIDPTTGEICVELEDPPGSNSPYSWTIPSCIEISARLWDHTTHQGFDSYFKKIRLTRGSGDPFECAEVICDIIRCAFFQQSGFWVECRVDDADGDGAPEICLGYQDGRVDWGNFSICATPEVEPQITAITPVDPDGTLEPGDIIVIDGNNFPPDPKDICLIAMADGDGRAVPFDVLGATTTRMIAKVVAVPDGFTNGNLMMETGIGVCDGLVPRFDDIEVVEPGWVWRPGGLMPAPGGLPTLPPFNPDPPVPDPLKLRYDDFFIEGTPKKICVEIPEADYPLFQNPECCIRINARLRDHTNNEGYDAFTATVKITDPGLTFEEWLERLCDTIRCQFIQSGGFATDCTISVAGGVGKICIGFDQTAYPGFNVDWGTLAICIECPPPVPTTPVITGIRPATIRPGTVVEVTGQNFGDDPDDVCAVGMIGDRTIPIEVFEARPDLVRGVVGPLPPDIAGLPVVPGLALGEGTRGIPLPLFDDLLIPDPVWAWKTIPGAGDATGDPLTPNPGDPGPNTVWYHSEEPRDGKMCIFLPDAWPAGGSLVTISGRMRDHTTGKGYDQFASSVELTGGGPGSGFDCAMRICDTLRCAWSQLAGVQVDCTVEPFGVDGAKIVLGFANGSVDWGHIQVCVTDLAAVTRFDDWKNANGVTDDEEDNENGGAGDGNAAVLEALFGADPNVSDPQIVRVRATPEGAEDVVSFRVDPDITDVEYFVECSDDLTTWIPIALNPVPDAAGNIEIRWPRIPGVDLNRFYRLRAVAK